MVRGVDWATRVGQRVSVRYRTDDGAATDVVGDLTNVDDALHVAGRDGPVRIPLERVLAGRVVPPRPSRPGPPHLVISVTDLQNVMALHWRPLESEPLGGWVLRAAQGFTGRANSALPLADPGLPVDTALARTVDWYAARGLPAKLSLAGPAPDADVRVDGDAGPAEPARAAAVAAGWQVVPDGSALVMTARTADLGGLGRLPAGLTVTVDAAPDAAWLANYRYRGQTLPPAAPALLRSAPEQVFVAVRTTDGDARTVAVARGSLGGGWAGLTAVEVVPTMRRRGLGTVLLGTVADWARRAGVTSIYLQVAESNATAHQVYRRAGFSTHHRYDYLQAPASAPPPSAP